MKKNIILLTSFFILLGFLLIGCISTNVHEKFNKDLSDNNGMPLTVIDKTNKKKHKEVFEIIEKKEEEDFLLTSLKYPDFKNYQDLSTHIKNKVESGWQSFKNFAEKDWLEITSLNSNSLPPYEYYVDTEVSSSDDIISVYFSIYSYKGGAHGQTITDTVNYDKHEDKFIHSIIEVSNYTYEELSDICRKELYNKLISDEKFNIEQDEVILLTEMIDEGTLPIAANFESYTFNDNDITIYFDQGKVAPQYYGILSVTFKAK